MYYYQKLINVDKIIYYYYLRRYFKLLIMFFSSGGTCESLFSCLVTSQKLQCETNFLLD